MGYDARCPGVMGWFGVVRSAFRLAIMVGVGRLDIHWCITLGLAHNEFSILRRRVYKQKLTIASYLDTSLRFIA